VVRKKAGAAVRHMSRPPQSRRHDKGGSPVPSRPLGRYSALPMKAGAMRDYNRRPNTPIWGSFAIRLPARAVGLH